MLLAITDDSSQDREELIALLERYFKQRRSTVEYACFSSAEELLDGFVPGKYQIVFQDIYLSGLDGMEAARRIHQLDPACRLIFFTISHTHAVESYTVQAAYYLTKPLDYAHLEAAMDAVCAGLLRDSRFLTVHCSGLPLDLLLRNLLFVDCQAERTRLHLSDRVVIVDDRASNVLSALSEDGRFLACNRNTAVNMDWIEKVLEDDFLLKNGERVPIRQRGRKAVKLAFLQYTLQSLQKEGTP